MAEPELVHPPVSAPSPPPPAPVETARAWQGPEPDWVGVAVGEAGPDEDEQPLRRRVILLRVIGSVAVVLLLVAVVSTYASRRLAEREAVNGAAHTTDLLADTVVQPELTDGLLSGRPDAVTRLDEAVRSHVLTSPIVRVKVWSGDGRIVYSDEPRLIGQRFPLDEDESRVFATPRTAAEVTDLSRPENRFEVGQGKLLEVYRPVWTPSGQPLLFETYAPYSIVTARSGEIWRGVFGVTLSSLLLLIVLLIPVVLSLLRRLDSGRRQREQLLRQAIDASAQERRRIAASLHDGVVQDLAATSFGLTAAGRRVETNGTAGAAGGTSRILEDAATQVRSTVQQLRSLLVDIYPAGLRSAGLATALTDLAATARGRGPSVHVAVAEQAAVLLDADQQQMVFRVAQECLRNAVKHAEATQVEVLVRTDADTVVLEVCDDGTGFDGRSALMTPEGGHFGLRLLSDAVAHQPAELELASAPGCGTRWRLTVHTGMRRAGPMRMRRWTTAGPDRRR